MSVDNHNILSNNSIEVIIITNCTNCGSVVDQGSKFCGACGTPVVTQQLRCPHCKSEVDQNDRFCGDCGTPVPVANSTDVGGTGNRLEQQSVEFVCPKCNKHVSDEWKVCSYCGEELVEVVDYSCSKCGRDVDDDWKLCPYCGESLDETQ